MCVRERGTVASHAISRVPAAASIESENGKREALIECSLELARPLSLPLNLFLNKQKKRGGEKTPGKLSLEQIAKKAAEQGYAGIECSVRLAAELDESDEIPPTSTSSSSSPSTSKTAPAPVAGAGRGLFASTLKRHGLSWTPVVLSSGPVWRGFDPFVDLIDRKTPRAPSSGAAGAATPEQHAAALAGQLDAALALCPAADLDALFLSSHADEAAPRGEAVALVGSDAMGTPDAMRTVRACSREAEERGFSLCFETHRGRVFGSPWDALDLLREMAAASAGPGGPPLPSLCLDASHWTVACEALPGERPELDLAVERVAARLATRLHLRVGDCQGAQVAVPWSREDAAAREGFERWWRAAAAAAVARGAPALSATPEFGPSPYQRAPLPSGEERDVRTMPSVEELDDWAAETMRRIFEEEVAGGTGS